jgi:hypothetical protein
MRVAHSRRRLPRVWSTHPQARGRVIAEHDIKVSPRSRLRAKLLVFRNRTALNDFWEKALKPTGHGERLGLGCQGAVNALQHEIITIKDGRETRHIEVDPRYFCLIGLVRGMGKFTSPMEVISHEAVHAGFAYAKRIGRTGFWVKASSLDEEDVCYPAGRVARAINIFLHERGLF